METFGFRELILGGFQIVFGCGRRNLLVVQDILRSVHFALRGVHRGDSVAELLVGEGIDLSCACDTAEIARTRAPL